MVTVQFNFKTIIEAQEFLAELNSTISGPNPVQIQLTPVESPEKKKRGPKPKTEPVKEKEYGIEDCRTALSNLFDAKGREVAKSVLTEFKVARIGELKAEQYAAFVERCEAAGKPE